MMVRGCFLGRNKSLYTELGAQRMLLKLLMVSPAGEWPPTGGYRLVPESVLEDLTLKNSGRHQRVLSRTKDLQLNGTWSVYHVAGTALSTVAT